MMPYRNNFAIRFRKKSWRHDSRFVFKFHGNWPPVSVSNDWLFWWPKSSENAFFSPPFCGRLAEPTRGFQGSVRHELTYQCNISSQSVPICRSYFRKVISYDRSICLRYVTRCGPLMLLQNINGKSYLTCRTTRCYQRRLQGDEGMHRSP